MKILLHMPHASLKVPKDFYEGLTIPRNQFNKYNLEMSDVGVDTLFEDYVGVRVSPTYSRMFCDVERYRDDEKEIMSRYGEGVVYTHTYDGLEFHRHDESYKKKVLDYYDDYHQAIDELVRELLKDDDGLLIVDCHSYSDKMASHFFDGEFPDVCIGIEEDYYDQRIVDEVTGKLDLMGYNYKINFPYKGSFVPNCVLKGEFKDKKIVSIMLEVNKRVYL